MSSDDIRPPVFSPVFKKVVKFQIKTVGLNINLKNSKC